MYNNVVQGRILNITLTFKTIIHGHRILENQDFGIQVTILKIVQIIFI